MIAIYDHGFKTNAYINLTHLHAEDLQDLRQKEMIYSSVKDTSLFIDRILKYESEHDRCSSKGLRPLCGHLVTFLLDRKRCTRDLEYLSREVQKRFELPVFTWCYKNGKGYYLAAYVYDREYYENGKVIESCSKHDIYRNSKGRLCKSSDPEARLVISKGEISSRHTEYFSSKKDTFRFRDYAFEGFMKKLKEWYVLTISGMKKPKIDEARPIRRFQTKDRAFYDAKVRKIWNRAFSKIEKRFAEAIYALKMSGMFEQYYPKLKEISLYFENCRRNESFRYKRRSYNIGDARPLRTVRETIRIFCRICEKKVQGLMYSVSV